MAVTNLYHKSANFRIVNSSGLTLVEDLGTHNLTIPVISATLAEVTAAFNACSGDVFNNDGILGNGYSNLLDISGAAFGRFPTLFYTRNAEVGTDTPKASYFRLLQPGTPILMNDPYSSGQGLFINFGGLGFYSNSGGSGDCFIYSVLGQTWNTSPQASKPLGIYRATTGGLAGMGYYFITSDNRLTHIRLYYNKTNSGICSYSSANTTNIIKWLESLPDAQPENEDDPYNPGGESGTGGGTGDFDGTGDDIDFPSLPTLSAVDTGFITLFNPSVGQLQSLANYMWSTGFDLDTFKKLFADPMDAILGMSIVPVAVPNGSTRNVSVGNIPTSVSMTVAASQYVEVDCGTLNVNEYWGAYLDYDPFTKAEIYLPYIGTHPLAVDDIMGKAVHVKYHVDILSGSCCAYVKCGGSVMYSFVGQCSCSIPITGNDWTNVINGALSIAASIGTMVATGGATAPMAVTAIASTAVNSMKPNVEKSGSMGGMGGMLGVQTPYLILTRPRQALPTNQNQFSGYPSFITMSLSSVSGYTEIDSIHLEGIPATEQELSEIESLLKGGVIF